MPENCTSNDCPLEPRISALERANEQHGKTHRELFKRMNEGERDNAVQDAHYKTISKKLDEIGATVKTMADQVRSIGLARKFRHSSSMPMQDKEISEKI